MMPYMCDCLLPIEARYASDKYRRLSRWFDPWKRLPEDNIEVRAFMLTPGLLPIHHDALMLWDQNMRLGLRVLAQLDSVAQPYADANVAGVTHEDGKALLQTILGNFPDWGQTVPLWSTRYLQHRRRLGAKAIGLAKEFKTTPDRIKRWWSADMFDPLTALPRDRATLSRNRPRRRAVYRPTI